MLLREGWEVVGAFMQFAGAAGEVGCGSAKHLDDARRVARKLGIELKVLDLADEMGGIIDYFAAEYARGRTPNPCVHCNARLKFGRLADLADSLGAGVASGHHARVVRHEGRASLARAADRAKDQSYALFMVSPEVLERMVLPIGELPSKALVRGEALKLGLDVHDKPDSQDICFVGDGDDYARFLSERIPAAFEPGPIVGPTGEVLGTHQGYAGFTIGQRRGLGVACGAPMYVSRIDPARRQVTIARREDLQSRHVRAVDCSWHEPLDGPRDATVQIRYNHPGALARITPTTEGFEAEFYEPVMAVTPGQAAVIYEGERLLGGGWITG
jgi:tRNA-specific 2-thiouridylase